MLFDFTLDPAWPVLLSDPVARHPLNDRRIGWWLTLPGWEGGQSWYDLMGVYHGTVAFAAGTNGWRPTTRPGGWGHLLCDGSSSGGTATLMPQAAAPLNFADGNSISMAIWFRTGTNATGTYPALIGCVNDVSGGQGMAIISAPTSGGSSVYAYLGTSGGAVGTPIGGGVGQDNLWHRALAVYDRPASKLNFYIDGKLVNSLTTFNGSMAAGEPLMSGKRVPTTLILNGALDDATVWFPRALTAADAWMDFDLGRAGYPGVLNRLAPSVVAPIVYLVTESPGLTEVSGAGFTLGIAETPTGSEAGLSDATWLATEGCASDDPPALAASLEALEAPGADDSAWSLAGLLIVADVGASSEAAETTGVGAPILAIAELLTTDDLPTLAMAWEWLDTFAQSDVADHYDLLTPLDESATWDDPLGYVPLYQVSETGGAFEAPEWAVWTLAVADLVSLNADAVALASTLNAADRLPGDDLSGFVTPVMLVPDTATGLEAATLTPILVCADRGTCADSATLAATLLPTDSGSLSEPAATLTRVLLATEGVVGSDAPALASALTARDAGAASDALVSTRTGILTERGAPSERLAAAALWQPGESPTATEASLALAARMPLSDPLGGISEAILAAAGWRLTESPRVREVIITAASWAATDALGGPGEAPGLAARLLITDADTWYEAIGDIHLMVGIREGWVPRESPTLSAGLAVPEIGLGADSAALASRLGWTDASGLAEGLLVGATLLSRESPPIADGLSLAKLLIIADSGAERSTVLLAGGMLLLDSAEAIASLGSVAALSLRESASALDSPLAAAAWGATDRLTTREALTGATTLTIGESLTPLEGGTATFRLVVSEASIISEGIARSDILPLVERGSWRDLASVAALWGVAEAGRATDRAEGAAVWGLADDGNFHVAPTVAATLAATEWVPGREMLICLSAWQVRESGTGRDTDALAYSLAWTDAGRAVEGLVARALWQFAEPIPATETGIATAAWSASDHGGVADRAGAASAMTFADSVLLADSARSVTTFRLSEAPTTDAALFATARWYASEGLGAVETPATTPTLPATRLDTHLHSRIVPAAGVPAAPRARVTPIAPAARITPAPGTPDPGRSTVS